MKVHAIAQGRVVQLSELQQRAADYIGGQRFRGFTPSIETLRSELQISSDEVLQVVGELERLGVVQVYTGGARS